MPHVEISSLREQQTSSGRWRRLNPPLGLVAFGLNTIDCEPGEAFDVEHDERENGQQEAYVVLSGRAEFRVGEEVFEAGQGSVVAATDPAATRSYRALEPGTRILCIGAAPGPETDFGAWIDREEEEIRRSQAG